MNSASVAAETISGGMRGFVVSFRFYFIEIKRLYLPVALRRHSIYHLLASIIQCVSVIHWLITPEKKSVRRLWAIAAGNKFSLFLRSR
jgi:hypothetical protein